MLPSRCKFDTKLQENRSYANLNIVVNEQLKLESLLIIIVTQLDSKIMKFLSTTIHTFTGGPCYVPSFYLQIRVAVIAN
jgi:hypothetical protein